MLINFLLIGKPLFCFVEYNAAQKIKFSIKDFFSLNVTKSIADLVIFTEEILNGKLHFLCSVMGCLLVSLELRKREDVTVLFRTSENILHKKWRFPLKISLVRVKKSIVLLLYFLKTLRKMIPLNLFTFTNRILNGILHFLCSNTDKIRSFFLYFFFCFFFSFLCYKVLPSVFFSVLESSITNSCSYWKS